MVVIQSIEQVLAIMLKLDPYNPLVDLFVYLSKLTQLNRTTIIGIMFQEELVAYFIRQGHIQVLQSNFQARHIQSIATHQYHALPQPASTNICICSLNRIRYTNILMKW